MKTSQRRNGLGRRLGSSSGDLGPKCAALKRRYENYLSPGLETDPLPNLDRLEKQRRRPGK